MPYEIGCNILFMPPIAFRYDHRISGNVRSDAVTVCNSKFGQQGPSIETVVKIESKLWNLFVCTAS